MANVQTYFNKFDSNVSLKKVVSSPEDIEQMKASMSQLTNPLRQILRDQQSLESSEK